MVCLVRGQSGKIGAAARRVPSTAALGSPSDICIGCNLHTAPILEQERARKGGLPMDQRYVPHIESQLHSFTPTLALQ
jgi:hypothetical protein